MGIHLNFLAAPLVEIVMDPVGQVLQFLDQLPGSLNPPAVAFEMPELVGDEIRRFTEPSDPIEIHGLCLLYTSPSPRDLSTSRMPSSA